MNVCNVLFQRKHNPVSRIDIVLLIPSRNIFACYGVLFGFFGNHFTIGPDILIHHLVEVGVPVLVQGIYIRRGRAPVLEIKYLLRLCW